MYNTLFYHEIIIILSFSYIKIYIIPFEYKMREKLQI